MSWVFFVPAQDLQAKEEDDYDCTGSIQEIVDIRVLPAGPLIPAVSTLDYAVTGSAQNVHTRVSRAGALQTAEWGDKLGPDPPLKTDLHTLVLGEGTLGMAITPEVRMEAEAGERTLEVVWVGAGGAAGGRVRARSPAVVGIRISCIIIDMICIFIGISALVCPVC